METMYQMLYECLNCLPQIFSAGIIIYITPNAFRNFSIREKNSKRNWRLVHKLKDSQTSSHSQIIKIKLDKGNLNKLENILNSTKYPEELIDIVQTFKNHVSPENFLTCLRNLQTVKIKQTSIENDLKAFIQNLLSAVPRTGEYYPYQNIINLFTPQIRQDTLSHEFLHMASSKNLYQQGFLTFTLSDNIEVGHGFNEGYTELLNHRIFNSKSKSYKHNVKIVRLFETFFDNPEDVTDAYFNGSLQTIYQTFIKYGTKETFFEIMTNLDNLATTHSIYNEIISIKTQFQLYQIIKKTKNKDKIANFEQILDETPLTKLLRKGKLVLSPLSQKSKTK